jgi:hypothetical protein
MYVRLHACDVFVHICTCQCSIYVHKQRGKQHLIVRYYFINIPCIYNVYIHNS